MRTTTAIPILASAALALGACGGGKAAGGDARADGNRDAALEYARCMRENGVDMPDPRTDEGGGLVLGVGPGTRDAAPPPPGTMRKAQAACRDHLADLRPPEMSEERQAEFRERALAHARCMREQGIDFPDPQFGEGGGMTMHVGGEPGDGLDPRSPRFRRAMEACRKELGGGPIVGAAGGAGP